MRKIAALPPVLFLFLTLLLGLTSGCEYDGSPSEPVPAVYELEETMNGTGRLTVQVYFRNEKRRYQSVSRPFISVYQSYLDLENGISLARMTASSGGFADFGFLNAGTYYIRVFKEENGEQWETVEQAQIQPDRVLLRNIILY